MTLNTAIKRAIESGYKPWDGNQNCSAQEEHYLLDPAFWKSLTKTTHPKTKRVWLHQWHSFIDALASGKTAEENFQEILK